VALQAAPYALYALNGPWGSDYWGLSGNSGTGAANFVGTTNNMTLTLKVNNRTGLRLVPGGAGGGTPNVIGGSPDNVIASGIVGGVIGGGGNAGHPNRITADYATVGGGVDNRATAGYATVGGGGRNDATGYAATVGGGRQNEATAGSATVGGGHYNDATADAATVGGGYVNDATADYATVGGGHYNDATADAATVGGGSENYATERAATVGGGGSNRATAIRATIPGGYQAKASHYGEMAYAAGQFGARGDAQSSLYVLRNTTNNATTTELFLDGSGERLTLANNRVLTFDILVVAARTSGGNSAGYHFTGVIENIGGTTSLLGVTSLMEYEDQDWAVAVEADDTNDALVIKVTGPSNTVRWVATARTVEVGF
jgi:hypothetical protein